MDKLEDDVIHTKYRELACSIILQTTEDFLNDKFVDDYHFYKWIADCSYFDYLDLDREYFYVKVLKLKKKGIKKVGRLNG